MADRIVVGVDGSPGSRRALAWATDDATARGAVVEAVMVWQSPYDSGEEPLYPVDERSLSAEAAGRLDEAVSAVTGRNPAAKIEKLVLRGDPAWSLCERSADAVELVVGSRGHGGLTGALLGSVSTKCAHHAPGPMVIVPGDDRHRGPDRGEAGRIVVGVDRSAGAASALEWALEEAGFRHWTVDAVEAWADPYGGDMSLEFDLPHFRREHGPLVESAQQRLDRFVEEAGGRHAPVPARTILVDGDPAAVLCDLSGQADLLVVGSRGRGGFARLVLGSVSTSCAHHSRCPVAIIPPRTSADGRHPS